MTAEVHPVWAQIVQRLETRIKGQGFSTWIQPLRPSEVSRDALHLEVPNAFFIDWIDSHYIDHIREAAATVIGNPVEVLFHVNPMGATPEGPPPRPEEDHR